MKWAFSDESRRKPHMLMAAVIIDTHAVAAARQEMRTLLLPRQRRLHMTDERQSRRDQILDVVARLPVDGFAVVAITSGRRIPDVRADLLRHVAGELIGGGVERWTLDGVEGVERDRDRSVLTTHLRSVGAELLFDHLPTQADPLLWAADAVAWAVGSGGRHLERFGDRLEITQLEP
ncbi:MAG: hypothetical protein OSA99_19995 [Acidimicrobiales bacterium]|nr:hypothetical protein [Acidimicrobiales bacterium]